MPYLHSTLIAKQHGWGDTPTAGQSIGQILGGLLTGLTGGSAAQPTQVVQQTSNTGTYLLLGAAGIGAYLLLRRKKR